MWVLVHEERACMRVCQGATAEVSADADGTQEPTTNHKLANVNHMHVIKRISRLNNVRNSRTRHLHGATAPIACAFGRGSFLRAIAATPGSYHGEPKPDLQLNKDLLLHDLEGSTVWKTVSTKKSMCAWHPLEQLELVLTFPVELS